MAAENAADLNVALDKAACNFDVEQCRALLGQGADPKHVFRTNANGWYDGDTTSTLYHAVDTFKKLDSNQQKETEACYVDLVELLLHAGAEANFSARRGNWNRCTGYPLMDAATKTLRQLSSADLKKRFLQAFAAAGAELNARSVRGRQGGFGGFGSVSYSLFDVVRKLTPGSDLSLLEVYIDAGVRVNCSESSYSVIRERKPHCAMLCAYNTGAIRAHMHTSRALPLSFAICMPTYVHASAHECLCTCMAMHTCIPRELCP